MLADSVKLKGFSCFKDDWAGFDEFKPITVIIGRNNTGKSHLLDVVELLTKHEIRKCGYEIACYGTLDSMFLQVPFKRDTYGGMLSPHHSAEQYTHWNYTGKHYNGKTIYWELAANGHFIEARFPEPPKVDNSIRDAAEEAIANHLPTIRCALSGKVYRRLLADRDIYPEQDTTDLTLDPSGSGATNIIRRYISSAKLSESLIQEKMLNALCRIFGPDAEFDRIEIRQHDETDRAEVREHWEIFLGEQQKGLIPLSSSGSGLKTVFLVLLNLLVIPDIEETEEHEFVFAFEELENNLHPALLRRLLNYISDYVETEKCCLFITTHSNVALDYFSTRTDSQIIHVAHDGKSAKTKSISTHFDHVGLLTELGARPSDLLQANGVIWLEGPSDRIYFNRFIDLFSNGEIREGRDYQCAFYGGSNLAKTTFAAPEDSDDSFANLLRLNHNVAVICDGDRTGKGTRIKKRVQRIKQEVGAIPEAYLWITAAKEIENYIPGEVWAEVFKLKSAPDPGPYDRFSSTKIDKNDFVQKHLNRKSFDKVDFAMKAADHLTRENLAMRFDFEEKMTQLIEKIKSWNK